MGKDFSKFWAVPSSEPNGSYQIVSDIKDSMMVPRYFEGQNRKIDESSFWMYDGYNQDEDEWN